MLGSSSTINTWLMSVSHGVLGRGPALAMRRSGGDRCGEIHFAAGRSFSHGNRLRTFGRQRHRESRLPVDSRNVKLPPCSSAAAFASASPRPMPSGLDVIKGSNIDERNDSGGPLPESAT